MTGIQDRPNRLPWPPIVYLSAIALAVLLHWLLPLPWLSGPVGTTLSELLFAVGLLVVAGGLAIVITAVRTMARAGTAVSPIHASKHLVTGGPFSFTRNPIYLGAATIMIGLGLASSIAWFILLAPLAGFTVQKLAIEREERHLEARFGKKWRDYAKKVRRWI